MDKPEPPGAEFASLPREEICPYEVPPSADDLAGLPCPVDLCPLSNDRGDLMQSGWLTISTVPYHEVCGIHKRHIEIQPHIRRAPWSGAETAHSSARRPAVGAEPEGRTAQMALPAFALLLPGAPLIVRPCPAWVAVTNTEVELSFWPTRTDTNGPYRWAREAS